APDLAPLGVGAPAARMARPVADSPVKVTRSTPGCSVRAWPASPGPNPWTTLKTPGGSPAWPASSPRRWQDAGDCSAGFRTTVFPKARAGATFQLASISGKFQGEMAAATPAGSWRVGDGWARGGG